MANIEYVQVANPSYTDGDARNSLCIGHQGDLLTSPLHGQYYEANRRGNLYQWSSGAAGITILKYDNVTPAFVLWNKSLKYTLEIVEVSVSWSGTPAVAGNIGYVPIIGAGAGLGVPISAFTELATARKCKTFATANPPNGKCATTVTIAARAAADYTSFGFSIPGATAAATTTAPGFMFVKQFRGDFNVAPGNAIAICGNVAQTAVMEVSISWIDNVPYTV
jgi:hypothetical protein